ncbi:hypothetical protein JYU34_010545 [Plutella xylostella]|uniref:Transmembrane protein 131-like N-terminal domain-containing protein n=1 Tax=Plutella xylostella TaxID=51655 RepID=A0ABQ7QJW1_PLUXY|nr:hypothetical protein JYU34_010545 [Plutella xylostella]
MNRQILRFYVFVLTLLEISLNSKLTAQGKSHGVLHDPLISDGITFQEWGTETVPVDTGGDPGAEAALTVSPAELHFGPSELGVAHARTVTLTNRSNSTLHLASVAGSTPHFHASFFDSKTLAPHANTSFSVVFVGRREGLASARLHLHSSAAPLAYSVSAVGVASRWGLWPWLHAAVPAGARLAPTLSLTNPTDKPVQVLSVYSSAPWLGLELAGGGGWAPRSAWTLPPRAARPLVAVRLQPPPASADNHTRTKAAYIRIKTEIGSLVVGVEARAAPRGLFLAPLGLRAGSRGSRDPPLQMEVSFGNSAATALPLDAWLSPPHCAPLETAPAPPDPPEPRGANGGARPAGVSLTLLMNTVEANSPLKKGAIVTFDFEKLWSSYTGPAPTGALLCAGWLTAGGAAAPYSVALQRGTLSAPPPVFVTSSTAAPPAQPLVVHNEFRFPVLVTRLQPPPALLAHVQMSKFSQVTIGPGARAELVTLRPRPAPAPAAACAPPFQHPLTIHTNFTDYVVMVSCYSGLLELQFQWPDSTWSDLRHLRLGGVPAGAAVAVPLRVRNPAPAPLCLSRLHAAVGAVTPATARTGCIPPGGSLLGTYVVRAPAAGALTDAVGARSEGAEGRGGGLLLTRVSLHAMEGKVTVDDVELKGCAPWVPCSGPLVVRSTARTQSGVGVRTGRPALVHEYVFFFLNL